MKLSTAEESIRCSQMTQGDWIIQLRQRWAIHQVRFWCVLLATRLSYVFGVSACDDACMLAPSVFLGLSPDLANHLP